MPITEEQIRRDYAARKGATVAVPTNAQVMEQVAALPQQTRTNAPTGAVAGAMQGAMGAITGVADTIRTRISAAQGDEGALVALGQREGVPLDVATGAGVMARLGQTLAFNREEQALLLKRLPNVQDVRFNTLGEPVLTVTDAQTGDTRDILANPVGIDPSDFAFIAANLPEMVGGMLGAIGKKASKETVGVIQRLGRWLMSKDVVPSAGRMAVAGQLAGAAKDVIGRGLHPALNIDAEEIGERRAVAATTDFLFGISAGVAGKVSGRAISPMSNRGPLQVDAEAAAQLWKQKAGIDLNLTPAETSGSRILGRAEAFMAQKPGSSAVFDRMMDERREAVGKIQNILLGADPALVPHADVVGQSALQSLKADIAPLDFSISREAQAVMKQATDDILSGVSKATGASAPVPESAVGARLSERAFKRLEEFRAQSRDLYGKIHSNPAVSGQGRNIDATPLAEDAKKILAEVAAVEKQVEKPTGLVSPTGQALTREESVTEQFGAFVDSGARAKLEQLANADGGKVALRDLIELRRDIDDELFRGGALTGLPERRLSNIREALTQRIEGGLKELDDSGALLADFKTANDHYAENIRRFKEVDIVEMFKGPQDRGVLGLNQVVTRAISDPDRWRSYSDFFGANSPEMTLMRRAYADRVLGRLPGDEIIDAGAFLSRLESAFTGNGREIAADVFGQSASELRGLAMAAKEAGKANVNASELAGLINQKSLTAEKVRDLIAAQAKRDETLKNSILNKISKGIDGPDSIKPTEFVNAVVFKSEPSELADVVSRLSDQPELLASIKQRTLLKIFSDSMDDMGGKDVLNATKLSAFLNDETMAKRLEPVLGSETMRLLRATRNALKPGQANFETFASSGRLAAASQIGTIERHFAEPGTMFTELGRIAKSFILAGMYKTGPVRAYMANSSIRNRSAFINSFIVAEPVVEDLARLYGDEMGNLATLTAMELKSAIDTDVREGAEVVRTPTDDEIRAAIRARQPQTNN